MKVHRRQFIGGLSAMIAASALGSIDAVATLGKAGPLPNIVLPIRPYGISPATMNHLVWAVRELYRQVSLIDSHFITHEDYQAICEMIDRELYKIKPAGVHIEIETTLQRIMDGDFEIIEDYETPGLVVIR